MNYHQSPASLEFLLINPMIPLLYYLAARFVKTRLSSDMRLHSMRDVLNLLLYSLAASFVAASLGTAILTLAGSVPRQACVLAAFDWWIGDAVALSSVSTFLLRFVLPQLRRFLGICRNVRQPAVPDLFILRRKFVADFTAFCLALFSAVSWPFAGAPPSVCEGGSWVYPGLSSIRRDPASHGKIP